MYRKLFSEARLRLTPVWEAECDGEMLVSDTKDSGGVMSFFLMLIPTAVSGVSAVSISSPADSESDPSEPLTAESDWSDGRYSCFSGDDTRRLGRSVGG